MTAGSVRVAVISVVNRACGPLTGVHIGAETVDVGLVSPSDVH